MTCENCRQRPASVHLTKVINGQKSETHLCDQCAREQGQLDWMQPLSIPNLLASLLSQEEFAPKRGLGLPAAEPRCPGCGITYSRFAETGRLGCSQCWEALGPQLSDLLRRIHGTIQHTGKVPKRTGGLVRLKKELHQMREELNRAVANEEFEKAAALRDRIRDLERKVKAGGEAHAVE